MLKYLKSWEIHLCKSTQIYSSRLFFSSKTGHVSCHPFILNLKLGMIRSRGSKGKGCKVLSNNEAERTI